MKKELLIIGILFLAALVAAIAFWPRIQDTPPATEAEPVTEERDTPGIPPTAEAEDFRSVIFGGPASRPDQGGNTGHGYFSVDPELIETIWRLMRPETWGEYLPDHDHKYMESIYLNFDGYSQADQGCFLALPGDYIAFVPKESPGITTDPDHIVLNDLAEVHFYQLSEGTYDQISRALSDSPAYDYDPGGYGSMLDQALLELEER